MKIVILIARLLLGLISVVFGLNGFLNFLSMGPMPTGLAGQFVGALHLVALLLGSCCATSHRRRVVAGEPFCAPGVSAAGPGNREYTSVSLFLNPAGIGLAIVVTLLWFIVFYGHRQYFSGIFAQGTPANQSSV
jgi:hypothetical protein